MGKNIASRHQKDVGFETKVFFLNKKEKWEIWLLNRLHRYTSRHSQRGVTASFLDE